MQSIRKDIGGLGNLLFKEAYIWSKMREGNIPDVYVQGEKYWKKYAGEIKMRFSSGIGKIDKVALHIRRGDYLKVSQFHTNLWNTDYYKEGIKHFPNETFLIFCRDNQNEAQDKDDQDWLKVNIPLLGIKFELYEHGSETDDLNAMASCKGLIGANSSFSWWAAFLGDPKKRVVMPKEENWFLDKKIRTELLPEWILI